ncbi:MAG: CotH kinase family protein [Flavobacteriaceae bacterium]|nr:CotH kinase family protein [Flavobacteriaceae bacterium]
MKQLAFLFFCLWVQLGFAQPTPNIDPGFYEEGTEIIFNNANGVDIYYTLNGQNPKNHGSLYESPIVLEDRSDEENYFSTIPTNNITSGGRRFQLPQNKVLKANVLRWYSIHQGDTSAVFNSSYFIGNDLDSFNLPVISIITDEENFFDDETGIYVHGNNGAEANYDQRGIEWERQIHLELFEEDQSLSLKHDAGARIHGGFSRRFPMKSLRLYARSDYGSNRFYYEFFPDQPQYQDYNRLILRNSGNDFYHTQFRDFLMQGLMKHMNFETQAGRAFVVFINGEYWGIQNARERYDKHYLTRKYGIEEEKLDLLTGSNGTIKEGDNTHFEALRDYLQNNDMTQDEHLQEVKTRMDTDNYIDYVIAQIYNGNDDWPHNNIDYWRYKREEFLPEAGKKDGRWRWMLYDIDRTLGFSSSSEIDMLEWMNRNVNSTLIFRKLMENEDFKNDFIVRFYIQTQTSFSQERISTAVDSAVNAYESIIQTHNDRWNISNTRYQNEINKINDFAGNRTSLIISHLESYYSLNDLEELSLTNDTDKGELFLNNLNLNQHFSALNLPFPFTFQLPANCDVRLSAKAFSGFIHTGWKNLITQEVIDEDILLLSLNEVSYYQPIYEVSNQENPINIADSDFIFSYWDANANTGNTPDYMRFYYMNESDPEIDATIEGLTNGDYNLNNRTRINGWNEGGMSFINTGNSTGNPGYLGTRLGAVGVSLDLSEVETAYVSWEGATVLPNSRIYNLRLRYRLNPDSPLQDVLDEEGNPITYQRNSIAQHREIFENIKIPSALIGKDYVELIWQYYYTGERENENSGQRSMMRLGKIHISEFPNILYPKTEPLRLVENDYLLDNWSMHSTYGSSPESMEFVYMNEEDPSINAQIEGKTYGAFFHTSRTRVNGLNENGFSMINTGNSDGNLGYPGTRLGGALLHLNTEGVKKAELKWKVENLVLNSRIYHLRLRYINENGELKDVLDENNEPFEFDPLENQVKEFTTILPSKLMDKKHVQLFWQYYYSGLRLSQDSGARTMIAINKIEVKATDFIIPTPIFPIEEVDEDDLKDFLWEGESNFNEESYLFQLSQQDTFENNIIETEVDDQFYPNNLSFNENEAYFWRIKFNHPEKQRLWSNWAEFSVKKPETEADFEIKLYPNPFYESLTLEFSKISEAPVQISIYDLGGKKVFGQQFQAHQGIIQLDDLDISSGIYLINIQQGQKLMQKKIIRL